MNKKISSLFILAALASPLAFAQNEGKSSGAQEAEASKKALSGKTNPAADAKAAQQDKMFEQKKAARDSKAAVRASNAMDRNKDGFISRAEYNSYYESRWTSYKKDKSGNVMNDIVDKDSTASTTE